MHAKPSAWTSEQLLFIFSPSGKKVGALLIQRAEKNNYSFSKLDMSFTGFVPCQQIKALATELCKFVFEMTCAAYMLGAGTFFISSHEGTQIELPQIMKAQAAENLMYSNAVNLYCVSRLRC